MSVGSGDGVSAVCSGEERDRQPSAVAIIPVRGGSVGIPRKNARLLAGKPLLAYAIAAAHASETIDAVIVSTEDQELAEVARRFGAEVLERSEALADETTTLDDVVVDAVAQLSAQGRHFDTIVTLQATCPLLRSRTIDRVVQRSQETASTVLTVTNAPHLAWGRDADGMLEPLYRERVNRQSLPEYFRETGGVVACPSETLASGTRFANNVAVVEVDKAEALDIDDHFDWWLVERSLQRRRIVFRVVGNRDTGLGHAYRALTLADRLIDHDLYFVVTTSHGLAADLIRERCYAVTEVSEDEELDVLRTLQPDVIVSDILDSEKSEMQRLKELGAVCVNFEDLGPGAALADFVVNALYDAPGSDASAHAFHGPDYCVLRDEFYSVAPVGIRREVRDVLLLFGGTDPNDLTGRCLRLLDALPGDWRITVVTGIGVPKPEAIESLARAARHPVEVVVNSKIVSRYMARADVAVTSAGRTVFELASLGVPTVVVPQNDRECQHAFALGSPGVVALPRASELEDLEFQGAVHEVIASELLRSKLSAALLAADIRGGIDRALDVIARAAMRSRGRG